MRTPIRHQHHRTIFLSDIHLGTKGCNAELLLDFLKWNDADTIYLVGDIVDGWRLKRWWYWPQAHNDVVQKILRKSRKGTRVVFIPGNHDEFARDYCGTHFGGIEVALDAVHTGADGRRHLVIHGDAFDGIVRHARWLAHIGDWAYAGALNLNTAVNAVRRRMGWSYWSLSARLKLKVKEAVKYIDDFERALATEAKRRGLDGVICGHIHHAEIREVDGIAYMNDGDWVESCTALVEDETGAFRILNWARMRAEEEAAGPRLLAAPRAAA